MARRLSSPILIGREAETRAFDVALQEARDGRPRVLVMAGEAGVGKTRLVVELAARTRAMGGTAIVGVAAPSPGVPRVPFAALIPILRGLVRSIDARLIDRMLRDARRDLAALLPELGPGHAPAEEPEPFAAARLSESVLIAFEAVARLRPPLVAVFEDMHWADDATRSVVAYVTRNLADSPVVTIVTYREDATHDDDRSLDFVAELARLAGGERLDLAPLGPDEVGRQVRAILGEDPEAEIVRALVRRSGGNPFFVEELVAAIVEGGVERPPPSIRTMVESRMSRVSPRSRALVELAAVCDGAAPADLLAAASSLSSGDFDAAFSGAVDAGILAGRSGAAGDASSTTGGPDDRIDFRHVLVREVIVAGLSPPRRRELHLRLAAAIDARPSLGGASRLERASRLADHRLMAGDGSRAVVALLRAAAAAEDARAFGTADEAYARALDAWRSIDDEVALARVDRADVLDRAARAASLVGDPRRAIRLETEALDAADAAAAADPDADADPELRPRLRLHLGTHLMESAEHERAVETLRAAADEAPDRSAVRALALTALARELMRLRRVDDAARIAAEAAALADAIGDRRGLVAARSVEALALARLGRTDDAHRIVQASAHATDDDRRGRPTRSRPSRFAAEIQAFVDRAAVLDQAGDPAAAARVALEGRDAAERHGLARTVGPFMRALAARSLVRTGRWDEAAALLDEDDLERGREDPGIALVRALLATRRGDWDAAERSLQGHRASPFASDQPGWASFASLVESELACERGRYAEARGTAAHGIASGEDEGDRTGVIRLAALGIRIEADAAAAIGRRHLRDAVAAIEIANGYLVRLRARAMGEATGALLSPSDEAVISAGEAEMRRLSGGPDRTASWDRAAASSAEADDPYAEAYARMRSAEASIEDPATRATAAENLRLALRTADRLGAMPLARSIEALARRARLRGVRIEARPADALEPPGYAAARSLRLSEREIEVLALIASGLSDREIAERLFITTKTAGHHVSHILDKLGVDRRGEAAAIAYRIGLVDRSA
jgi:DNA-binding CsgD family transcriptional regulator